MHTAGVLVSDIPEVIRQMAPLVQTSGEYKELMEIRGAVRNGPHMEAVWRLGGLRSHMEAYLGAKRELLRQFSYPSGGEPVGIQWSGKGFQ
jgi:hypothetical protein